MRFRTGIYLAIVVAIALLLIRHFDSSPAVLASTATAPSARPVTTQLADAAPRAAASSQRDTESTVPSQIAKPSPRLAARERLATSGDWKEDLAWLESTDLPPGDKLLYRAMIYESCSRYEEALRLEGPEAAEAIRSGNKFFVINRDIARATSDRQRSAMEFATRRKVWNICAGFANAGITPADVEKAFADAAAAGSPAAQARVIAARQVGAVPAPTERGVLSPADHEQLLSALFSADPIAIRAAGAALSIGSERQSLRIGDEEVDLGNQAYATWTLAACSFGFECGARNVQVNMACAMQGRCADDYASYLRQYVLSAADYERVEANARAIADAIRRRDADAFHLVDRPGNTRTYMSGIPPRVMIR